jgi:hypothetical protein
MFFPRSPLAKARDDVRRLSRQVESARERVASITEDTYRSAEKAATVAELTKLESELAFAEQRCSELEAALAEIEATERASRTRRVSGTIGVLSFVLFAIGVGSCQAGRDNDLLRLGMVLVLLTPVVAIVALAFASSRTETLRSRILGITAGLATVCGSFFYCLWELSQFSMYIPSGRPFRVGRRPQLASTRTASQTPWTVDAFDVDLTSLDPRDRVRIGRRWLEDARAEHASVAAFSKLSLDLLSLGAPPALLEATHRAALDEVRHARICSSIARAYLGEPAISFAPLPAFAKSQRSVTLETLATESLIDGCLSEGFAARVLRETANTTADPVLRSAISSIAEDEERHTELAWDIVEFCLRDGGEAVGSALWRVMRTTLTRDRMSRPKVDDADIAAWRADAIWEDFTERLRDRLEADLLLQSVA